jgi:energy-coupling factor transporter transmembrane protein EcfT
MTQAVRWQLLAGIGLLVALTAVLLALGPGRQPVVGALIVLAPVAAVAWLARRLPTRVRWVVIGLLAVLTPILVFMNLVAGCMMTTGFGGASCYWDHVPWAIRDFIREVWATLTGQSLDRDLFPF